MFALFLVVGLLANAGHATVSSSPLLYLIGGNTGGTAEPYTTGTTGKVFAFHLPGGERIENLARLPTGRRGHGVATISGLIYAVGGREGLNYLNTVDVYNSTENKWHPTTPMSTARYGVGVCVVANKLYAVGGQSINNGAMASAEVFDPTTKGWTPIASMSTRRYLHGVGVLKELIYAVGGRDGVDDLSSVERYNPTANQWARVASMHLQRQKLAAAVLNGKLYAIGGCNNDDVYFKSVEVYDPAADAWRNTTELPEKRGWAGVAVMPLRIYVVGGNNGTHRLGSSVFFDPTRKLWTPSNFQLTDHAVDDPSAIVVM